MGKNMPNLGKGLKRARKKAGYRTQEILHAALESYGIEVTLETVRNWEQGKSCPSMEVFLKLCSFFDCSADYLLYQIEERTHDLKYICEYTGLTEESVNSLHFLKDFHGDNYLSILNILIYDCLHNMTIGKRRSVLSLLYYFLSIDINIPFVYTISNSGVIKKEKQRPEGYYDNAMYFDARINENAALIELQETLTRLKREYIDSTEKQIPSVSL